MPPEADAWDSESDGEYEDEDDEDSNGKSALVDVGVLQNLNPLVLAEDWYTNDYPDEEESDEPSDGKCCSVTTSKL